MADKTTYYDADDEGQSGSGQGGGASGQIEFHDFITPAGQSRDDQLSSADKRAKLGEHNGTHEARVKAQKDKRDQYKDLKNGKIQLETFRAEKTGAGQYGQYKQNPILAKAAQFSGKEPQVNSLPNDQIDANRAEQDELRLRLGQRFENTPKFNPRPLPH